MLSDETLSVLMGRWAADDKDGLIEMLSSMNDEDKTFFKGYVEGFARGVEFAQLATVEDAEGNHI